MGEGRVTDPRAELAALAAKVAEVYAVESADLEARVLRQLARRQARGAQPVKPCATCGEDLPALAFAEDVGKPDGLKSVCKPCDAVRARDRRASPCPGA